MFGKYALLGPCGVGASPGLAGLTVHLVATWNHNVAQLLQACPEPLVGAEGPIIPYTEAKGGPILDPRACWPQALVPSGVSLPL